jgi:hypothetical protein
MLWIESYDWLKLYLKVGVAEMLCVPADDVSR